MKWHKEFAQENAFVWTGKRDNKCVVKVNGRGREMGRKAKKYGAYHTSRTSTHYTGYVTIGKLDTKPTKGHSGKERKPKIEGVKERAGRKHLKESMRCPVRESHGSRD